VLLALEFRRVAVDEGGCCVAVVVDVAVVESEGVEELLAAGVGRKPVAEVDTPTETGEDAMDGGPDGLDLFAGRERRDEKKPAGRDGLSQ